MIKSLQKKKSNCNKTKTKTLIKWMKKSSFLKKQLCLLLLIQNNHPWASLLSLSMSVSRVRSLMMLIMKISKCTLKSRSRNLMISIKMRIIKNTTNIKIKSSSKIITKIWITITNMGMKWVKGYWKKTKRKMRMKW